MPIPPPPSRTMDPDGAGTFTPMEPQPSPENPSEGAAPAPAQTSPGAMEDMGNILQITSAARRIGTKYPTAVPEVQIINDAVQKLQMKIMMVQPPAEVAAPPQ